MSSEHSIEIRVRYSETDAMGIVHHANYLHFFEMGRTELFRSKGGNYRQLEEAGYFLVVISVQCNYRSPSFYDDVLTLTTTLKTITPAKMVHEYRLTRDGVLLADGESVLACVDKEKNVRRIPDFLIPSTELIQEDKS